MNNQRESKKADERQMRDWSGQYQDIDIVYAQKGRWWKKSVCMRATRCFHGMSTIMAFHWMQMNETGQRPHPVVLLRDTVVIDTGVTSNKCLHEATQRLFHFFVCMPNTCMGSDWHISLGFGGLFLRKLKKGESNPSRQKSLPGCFFDK